MEQLHEFLSVSTPLLCARYTALIRQVHRLAIFSARRVHDAAFITACLSGKGCGVASDSFRHRVARGDMCSFDHQDSRHRELT